MTITLLAFALSTSTQDVGLGRRVFTQRCASCHFVPDRSIRTDAVWLELLQTTA